MAQQTNQTPFQPQTMTVSELITVWNSDPEKGLSAKAAKARRRRFGSNSLRNEIEIDFGTGLKNQCKGLTNLLLFLTMLLFYLFEQQTVYLIGMLLSVLLMLAGAALESAAARMLRMPGKYALFSVQVIRDGVLQTLDSRLLVPGDLILLKKGCMVPADVRILSDNGQLTVLETPVSGVKTSVRKSCRLVGGEDEAVSSNMLYAGTILTDGECRALVCRTGKQTLTRQIHARRADYLPTLLCRVRDFCRIQSVIGLLGCLLLLAAGTLRNAGTATVFALSAVIGASTLCDSTLSLAYIAFGRGVRDMAKDRLIVRNPDRVARLAEVNTVMCTKQLMFPPKRIRLLSVYTNGKNTQADGLPTAAMQKVLKLMLVCSDHPRSYTPYEQVVRQYFKDACIATDDLTNTWFRMDTAVSEAGETVGVLAIHGDHTVTVIKGAPENVLSRCAGYEQDGKEYRLNDAARRNILAACENAAKKNAYLIAVASGKTDADSLRSPFAERQLIFRGFLSFRLSMEVDIANAVYRCVNADVEAVVSTNDPYYTAASIGRSAGLIEHEGQMISSAEIKAQERGMFVLNAPKYKLFLEPTDDQWLDVLLLRKQAGRVVAATATEEKELPLLREADVSVVSARSADALRASADLLMAESGFQVLADGITDARAVCFRLRWLLQYLTAGAATLFLTLLITLAAGLPFPFGVSEVLFGGILLNACIAATIAFLPVDRRFLADPLPPVQKRVPLRELLLPALYASGSACGLTVISVLTRNPTAALPAFVLSQFLYVCGCFWQNGALRRKRFGYRPFWVLFPFLAAAIAALTLLPWVRDALGFSPMAWRDWLFAFAFPVGWQAAVQGVLFLRPLLKSKNKKQKKIQFEEEDGKNT